MHLVERDNPGFSSIFRGMYWAIVTMTTVGYGDVVPMTGIGKFLASVVMIMGYGIIAVPTGIVSAEINYAMRSSFVWGICHHCGSQGFFSQCQGSVMNAGEKDRINHGKSK